MSSRPRSFTHLCVYVLQSHQAVSAYFSRKQLLPCGFARHYYMLYIEDACYFSDGFGTDAIHLYSQAVIVVMSWTRASGHV